MRDEGLFLRWQYLLFSVVIFISQLCVNSEFCSLILLDVVTFVSLLPSTEKYTWS